MREPHIEVFHHDEDKKQYIYRFPNGYGASVVRGAETHGGLEGLWELAVVRYFSNHPLDFKIDRTTPVGNEVHGHLTNDDVDGLLLLIENLRDGGSRYFA